jgi:hypothetical protein
MVPHQTPLQECVEKHIEHEGKIIQLFDKNIDNRVQIKLLSDKIEIISHNVSTCLNDIEYIKEKVIKIEHLLETKYLLKSEFQPIARIVYGLVAIILSSVMIAILSMVINK